MVVFEQVFILFFFGLVGYALAKSHLVDASHGKLLSALLVYVLLPANIFNTFSQRFSVGYLSENGEFLLLSFLVIGVLSVLAFFIGRLFSRDPYEQRIFEYTTVCPNFGYFGYALAAALFGDALEIMVFTIPVQIYVHTYGFATLTKSRFRPKTLLQPVTLAIFLGAALGLSGLTLPHVITDITGRAAACMGPISMLLAGIVVSEYRFRDMFTDKRTYLATAMRLLALPLAAGFLLSFFVSGRQLASIVLFFSLPCGLNTVVFPKLVDEDCHLGASMAILSNILACATIPLLCWIFGIQFS